MRSLVALLASATVALSAEKPPEAPTLARVVVTGTNKGGSTSTLFSRFGGKRISIDVSSQLFQLSDKAILLVVLSHKDGRERTSLEIGKAYAARGRLVVEGPDVQTGLFRLWAEGMLATKGKKRLVLLADSVTPLGEKNKASFPPVGKATVEGKAVCGKKDLKLADAPTLSVLNGALPVVLSGMKARADAAGKGVIRATGKLSVDKKYLLRLDAEKLETGLKAGPDWLAEDAIVALGGGVERAEGPGLAVVGVSLASEKVTDPALALLKHFPKAERLDLSGSRVTDAGLEAVKGMTGLRELALDGTKVADAGLARLKGLTKLEALGLSGTAVTPKGLEALKGLASLKTLSLDRNKITDETLAVLASMGRLGALAGARGDKGARPAAPEDVVSLSLYSTPVTDAGLAHLKGLTNLRSLELSFCKVGDAGLAHLKGLSRLESLYLYGTRVKGPGLEHLKGLTKLKSLSLDSALYTDEALAMLAKADKLHVVNAAAWRGGGRPTSAGAVLSFTLRDAPVTDAGLAHLKGLVNLESLSLYKTRVKGPGLAHLAGMKKLKSLYLGDVPFTDDLLGILVKADKLHAISRAAKSGTGRPANLAEINSFSLADSQVTDAGLEHLRGLAGLQSLNLQKAPIKGPGLAHLKGLAKLRTIFLSGNQITDEALAALVKADQLHALSRTRGPKGRPASVADITALSLEDTAITDAGLAHFKGLAGLQYLTLDNTNVTDAGLKHIQGLAKLKAVYLRKTKVTADGAAQLMKSVPALRVYR